MLDLPAHVIPEVADLSARYGSPRLVQVALDDEPFDPLTKTDRIGEVCMVIRRPDGRMLTMRKTFYPRGVLRLLTGGIGLEESIAAALLREVAEETSLDVAVRRFLALIAYTTPSSAPAPAFFTFAFLIDELGGELAVQDPDEQVELFGTAAPADLLAVAAALAALEDRYDEAIGGRWGAWGRFRAVVHRVVGELLIEGAAEVPST